MSELQSVLMYHCGSHQMDLCEIFCQELEHLLRKYKFFYSWVKIMGASREDLSMLHLLSIGPRWLMPRMYYSHIGLLYYP